MCREPPCGDMNLVFAADCGGFNMEPIINRSSCIQYKGDLNFIFFFMNFFHHAKSEVRVKTKFTTWQGSLNKNHKNYNIRLSSYSDVNIVVTILNSDW